MYNDVPLLPGFIEMKMGVNENRNFIHSLDSDSSNVLPHVLFLTNEW